MLRNQEIWSPSTPFHIFKRLFFKGSTGNIFFQSGNTDGSSVIKYTRGDTAFDIALTKVSDIVYGFDKPDLNPELLVGMSVLSNFSALGILSARS